MITFPNKKYQIIYADPPWRYDFSKSKSRKIENQYPTMSLEEICNLNIPMENNAVLYLWATAPKLREALKVMESWGFEYKTHMVWDKLIIGMGYWFRGQHELLLVGTRGKFSPPLQNLRTPSVERIKRGKHSEKPELFRERINLWYSSEGYKKIELFARTKSVGWDTWGNEELEELNKQMELLK